MNVSSKSQRFCLCLLIMCLVPGILAGAPVQAAVGGKQLSLKVLGGRLSLTADSVTLGEVFEGLHKGVDLDYEIPKQYLRSVVSVSFHGLPLEEGIQKVLRGLSYACVFHGDKMTKVIIVPKSDASQEKLTDKSVTKKKRPVERPSQAESPPTAEESVAEMEAGEIEPVNELMGYVAGGESSQSAEQLVAAMKSGKIELPNEIKDRLKEAGKVSDVEATDIMEHIQIRPMEGRGDGDNGEAGPSVEEIQGIIENAPVVF